MDSFEKVYNSALKFLLYRPRSEKEVRDYLKFKIHPFGKLRTKFKIEESVIDKIIEKLKKQGFINDEEFARLFVENRLRFKLRSLRLIKLELKQKGIEQDTIDNLINDLGFTIDDLEQAKRLVEKKLPRYKGLDRQKIYEKLGRYLASKGFDWDTIKHSIDEALKKGV